MDHESDDSDGGLILIIDEKGSRIKGLERNKMRAIFNQPTKLDLTKRIKTNNEKKDLGLFSDYKTIINLCFLFNIF